MRSGGAAHPLGPPRIRVEPPGPRSRELAAALVAGEAPGTSGFDGERPPVVWEAARGSRVRDADGNVYVDLSAGFGVVNVGHRHPAVVAAVRRQAGRLLHAMGDVFPHEGRARLAACLRELVPLADARVYFAGSGAEAVEIALKTAQLATGRPGVAAFTGGYHGLSYGALRVTWRPEFRAPFEAALAPPVVRLPFPDPFRPPLDVAPGALADACLQAASDALRAAAARRALPGAVVVEPLQGREGIVAPPPGWLRGLADLCRDRGVLLVADEVFTGFGRTGAAFACAREDVVPDVLVLGKGMAGGLPIGAAVASARLLEVWRTPGEALHTGTFLGHPLACAAALAALGVLAAERLGERAEVMGRRVEQDLLRLARKQAPGSDVRGRGLMWGLELVRQGEGREPDADRARRVAHACRRRAVLLLAGGALGNVLQVTPPLVLEEGEWEFAAAVLASALEEER